MHNPLENYLHDVECHLASLPAAIRESEVREASGHLQQLIADLKAQGFDEREASTRAMARFGSARSVGLRLRDVWEHNRGPIPVAFTVISSNWIFYSANYVGVLGAAITLTSSNGALMEALSPAFAVWITATLFLFPFALNFMLGSWGGRRVALAIVPTYLPLFWFAWMGTYISLPTSRDFRLSFALPFITILLTIFAAFVGAWCGAARQRKRRFALIGGIASVDEAAALLANPRRLRVRFLPIAAWLLGIGIVGGASFLFLKARTDAVLHPTTPEAAVRVWLSDTGMNMSDMKPATNVSTRLLPAASAIEKAGRERRVWYQATMHAGDEYRLRRIAYLQKQLQLGKKNQHAAYGSKYVRASLARLKPEGYDLQRVVHVHKTPDGWRVIKGRNGAESPRAWLYDIYYEGPK